MAMTDIPQKLQDQLTRFEQLKGQLQVVISQRGEIETRKKESETALKALEEHGSGEIYRQIGGIMLGVEDKDGLMEELKEDVETLNVRFSSLQKQENQLREMYEKLGEELNEALRGYQ